MPPVDPKQTRLLPISQACRMLGVSEATLRQWTDERKLKAFVTPGGHRRYDETDLKSLLTGQRHVHGIKDLVDRIESAPVKQREIAHQHFPATAWFDKLDEESTVRLRGLGSHLVGVIVLYVSRPSHQGPALEQARQLGRDFGVLLESHGLSLTESLEAFILHRTPVLDAAAALMRDKEPMNRRAANAIQQMTYLVDQVLLAVVQAHQNASLARGATPPDHVLKDPNS